MGVVKKKFKKDELLDMDMPWEAPEGGEIVSRDLLESSRWSLHYELIVRFPDQPKGEAWRFRYSVGASESQDERPWQYEDEVVATLVREREVVMKQWLPVEE